MSEREANISERYLWPIFSWIVGILAIVGFIASAIVRLRFEHEIEVFVSGGHSMINDLFVFAIQRADFVFIAQMATAALAYIFFMHWKENHTKVLGIVSFFAGILGLVLSILITTTLVSFAFARLAPPPDSLTPTLPPLATSTKQTPTEALTSTATSTPVPDEASKQEITSAINTLLLSLTASDLPAEWDNVITEDYKNRLIMQYSGENGISKHFKDRRITASDFLIDFDEPDHLSADVFVTLAEIVGEEKPTCEFIFLVVFKAGANNGEGAWLINSDKYWFAQQGPAVAEANCY